MLNLGLFISVILFVLMGADLLPQMIFGQSNEIATSNTTNQIKIPTHLDIESQALKQELSILKNLTGLNSTNNTETGVNQTNSSG